MNDIVSGKMGVNKAAEQYDVAVTTLKDRISRRVKHGVKSGPQCFLAPEKDQELAEFLMNCGIMGSAKTKRGTTVCEEVGGKEKRKG